MAHPNTKKRERVLDLGGGLAIWKAHLDALREQDRNARVMSASRFERLVSNVQKEGALESLPLCVLQKNQAGTEELAIISGHHRARAARAAGLTEIHVLVIERELARDEVIAKQLAHNALSGEDDPQVLAELYAEIDSIDAKLESGLLEEDLTFDYAAIPVDELALAAEHELVVLMFLPRQYARFSEVLEMLDRDAKVMLCDVSDFERFKEAAQEVSGRDDVRNVAAIISRMCDLVLEHYRPPEEKKPAPRRKARKRAPAAA